MAGFTVSRSYTMAREDVREIARDLAHQIETQYGVKARWAGDTVSMRGNGVDGTLAIEEDTVRVEVSLGLMASVFERPLRRIVTNYLDEYVS
jgi:putative polyhydroxyalkanoate system protein